MGAEKLKTFELGFTRKGDNPEPLQEAVEKLNTALGPHFAHVARTANARLYLEKNGVFTVVGTKAERVMEIQGIILYHGFKLKEGIHVTTDSNRQHRLGTAFQLIAMFL